MELLAIALAPGIAICLFIYFKDRYNKEPFWMLVFAFALGIFSILPAVLIQLSYGTDILETENPGLLSTAFFSYVIVACSEEGSKFMMLRLFIYPRKHFDDPFDGIVYAVMIGMGFATLENLGYVYQHGMGTGIIRMFMAVPAHASFAVLMGYFTGFAKFNSRNRSLNFFLALFFPVLFHGTYDFFLFIGNGSLIGLGAIVALIIALYASIKAIRKKQVISKLYMEEKERSILPNNVNS
jgi:RsiW-degrading membrane proteinase PrsW (M82 family)